MGQGGFGTAYLVKYQGDDLVYKTFNTDPGSPPLPTIELDKRRSTADGAVWDDIKLVRGLELTATYLKDADRCGVNTPTHLIIEESFNGKPPVQHVVKVRGKEHRQWIKDRIRDNQNGAIKLTIVGTLQHKAYGENIADELDAGRITPQKIKPIFTSLITNLSNLADHGFVHGDIKPANLFYDSGAKLTQMIDTGGMVKVSKKADRRLETMYHHTHGLTACYTIPNDLVLGGYASHEQDLHATGVMMLELSARSKGDAANRRFANDLLRETDHLFESVANHSMTSAQAKNEFFTWYQRNAPINITNEDLVALDLIGFAYDHPRTRRDEVQQFIQSKLAQLA